MRLLLCCKFHIHKINNSLEGSNWWSRFTFQRRVVHQIIQELEKRAECRGFTSRTQVWGQELNLQRVKSVQTIYCERERAAEAQTEAGGVWGCGFSRGNITKSEDVINKSRPRTDLTRFCLVKNTTSCTGMRWTSSTFGRQSVMSYCSSEWCFPTNYKSWLCGSCYVSWVTLTQPHDSESLRLHSQQILLRSKKKKKHFQWVTKLFAPACIPKKQIFAVKDVDTSSTFWLPQI